MAYALVLPYIAITLYCAYIVLSRHTLLLHNNKNGVFLYCGSILHLILWEYEVIVLGGSETSNVVRVGGKTKRQEAERISTSEGQRRWDGLESKHMYRGKMMALLGEGC